MTLTKEWQLIAKSDSITFGATKSHIELYAKYNSQDITKNTTNYSAKINLVKDSGGYIGEYTKATCKMYGTGIGEQTKDLGTGNFVNQELINITGDVLHSDSGSKAIGLNGSVYFTAWGYGISISDQYVDLPTIPRVSDIACSSANIGETVIITIDNKNPGKFTNTITYKIGNLTGTIATKTLNQIVSLDTKSLKEKIYALIPNDTRISGTITCETFNGNTSLGTKSCNFNLYTFESECLPTITSTIVDTNTAVTNLTGSNTKFIKYISKPKVTINATPKYSATIKSYEIKINDGQVAKTKEATFSTIGSNELTLNAIDSREYGNPLNVTLDMIDYVKLHINNLSVNRPESTSKEAILNMSGSWYNGSFSTSKANTLTITYQYKKSSDTSWTSGGSLTPTKSGNTFTFQNLSLGSKYDSESEYQFKFTITDLLMTVVTGDNDCVLEKGLETMAIGEDGIFVYGDLLLNDISLSTIISNAILESDKKKYPVGSLEFNVSGTNPSTYLGFGTWALWGAGRVPVGVDTSQTEFNTVEKTGGEKTHKLTIPEIPEHGHEFHGANNASVSVGTGKYVVEYGTDYNTGSLYIGKTGGDQAHNNLQPYITCYMWKRTK